MGFKRSIGPQKCTSQCRVALGLKSQVYSNNMSLSFDEWHDPYLFIGIGIILWLPAKAREKTQEGQGCREKQSQGQGVVYHF